MDTINTPERGSKHQIFWHPKYGNVKLSSVWVTVEAITPQGPWLRVPGQPVLTVDWATWERMTDAHQ
jgi:hypothetical protein